MDLLATLRSKIETLDEGEHTSGLRAVLLHIETAFRHLSRGQLEEDEAAFTDSIYRTNQAFEGSIKEAYRVLAEKDPGEVRPFDIESYFAKGGVFRQRVLAQFTNYRTEWRNPSTHEYKLGFDESEAFLAIVSVSAFACLLLDQIAEKLSYTRSKEAAEAGKSLIKKRLSGHKGDLLARTAEVIKEFFRQQQQYSMGAVLSQRTEIQTIGALAGFFASAAPDLLVTSEDRLTRERPERSDLTVSDSKGSVLIEVIRHGREGHYRGLTQVERYMSLSGVKDGIVLVYPRYMVELDTKEYPVPTLGGRILVIEPKKGPSSPFEQIATPLSS